MKDEDKILQSILKDANYNINIDDGKNFIYDDEINKLLQESDQRYNNTNTIDDKDLDTFMKSIEGKEGQKQKTITFNSNIDFVNYIEKEYIKNTLDSLKNKDKVYLIQKLRKTTKKIKLSVLDVIKKDNLANRLYKYSSTRLYTSIAVFEDLIFAGNSIGEIKLFTCQKEYDLNKTFSLKELEKLNEDVRSVSCMHPSPCGDYLLAGYSYGFVVVWEIATTSPKKVINNIHKSLILDCKFISSNKKRWEFVTSDQEGVVQHTVVKDGLFSVSVDNNVLLKEKFAIHMIKFIKIGDMINCDSFKTSNINSEIQSHIIIAFASIESIKVFNLSINQKIWEMKKPVWMKESDISECSFGFGFLPNSGENQNNNSVINTSYNPNNQAYNNLLNVNQNQGKSNMHNIFTISWGKILYLNQISYQTKKPFIEVSQVGHFINSSPIIRMDIISESIVYLFESKGIVKVINTSLITPGDVKIDYSTETPSPMIDYGRNAEIEDGILVDNSLQRQIYLKDPYDNNKLKATFNNTIITTPKNIFILGTSKFHHLRLLNWEQCLNELSRIKSQWMDALMLGLDIYHGRSNALADIPTDTYLRETKVGSELRHMIHHYAVMHTVNERSFSGNSQSSSFFAEKLTECINVCIEFCLELGDVEYLLNTLLPLFDHKGYGDLFIEKLEPFILNDNRLTSQLQQMNVSKIIDLYTKSEKIEALSQILLHLDVKSMDTDHVKEICEKKMLITPLVYLYTNLTPEDYYTPLLIMWKYFTTSKNLEKFTNYNDLMEKFINVNELEKSKEFIGHKILWFINSCFKRENLFKSFSYISDELYTKIIFTIITWLFYEGDYLEKLLAFDSKTLFEVVELLYKDDKISSVIAKFGSSSDYIKKILKENLVLKEAFNLVNSNTKSNSNETEKNIEITLNGLLDFLIQYSKKLDFPKKFMYEFLVKISINYKLLNKNLLIEAAKFLLEHGVEDNIKDTVFRMKILEFSNILIDMIQTTSSIDQQDYLSLLTSANLSQFTMVKVFLQKKLKNFKGCLQTLLSDDNLMFNKEKEIFTWINDGLSELQFNSDPNFDVFKKEVLENLNNLAKLSIDEITKLVERWFGNDQLYVISKLDGVKDLQLKYVESVIDKFKEEADYNNESGKRMEQYRSLLKLHIKLLCKQRPNEVLPNLLKRGQAYPPTECLEYCMKYKVYDGAIYLKQTLGEIKEALEIGLKLLSNVITEIFDILKAQILQEKLYKLKSKELTSKLNVCVDILEKHHDNSDTNELQESMWLSLLEKLYKISSSIDLEYEKFRNTKNEMFYKDFQEKNSEDIKSLLEKMCSYVSIDHIIKVSKFLFKERH